MYLTKQISKPNFNLTKTSYSLSKIRFILVFLWLIIIPLNEGAKSEEIFLKCTGKFEINRGELIKPDWETSFLTINLEGLISTIHENGITRKGRTFIRRDSYTVTHRDNSNRIKAKYKINGTHGTYKVDYPQRNRTFIGTCEKGRG